MAKNINPTVEELNQATYKDVEGPQYEPSDYEKLVLDKVFLQFRVTREDRDRAFAYLDNRTLVEYIEDSVLRFITNVDVRDDIEDWQSRVHAPFTRNKILGVLGKVIDALPVAQIYGRGDEDLTKAEIVNTLFEYSEDVDNSEEFMLYAIEEALVKGTVIGYEGIETITKQVRDVVRYGDGDGITVKERTQTIRRLTSSIVPLEEFYPSSVGLRRIQDMPFVFTRKQVPFSTFLKDYQNFDKAKEVKPFRMIANDSVDRPFYQDYISSDVKEGNVEIIKYWNQESDEFVIMANGIWLNPLEGEVVSPIPFNHKKLPFFSFVYSAFGPDFFYGKSLSDHLKSFQDTLNVLTNMLLDQSFLSIFPPILVSGVDDIDDDFLRPGRRITVDTNGLPLNQAYMKLDLGTPNGWHQFILQYTKDVLEESSIDSVQQGVAGVGGRTTATEIRSAAAGVVSLLGLFSRFIRFGVKDRARLRIPNILQFYTDPKNPIAQGVLNADGAKKMSKAFNTFMVESSSLTPGNRGTKIVDLYPTAKDLPTSRRLAIDAHLGTLDSGKKVVKYAIASDYLRDFDYDLKLVANPKSESSKEVDRALEIQFQQTFLALYPDLANRKELAATLVEKFGKDPAKVIQEQQQQQPGAMDATQQAQFQQMQQGQGTAPSGHAKTMMPGPGGDNSANTVKGATGVGGESAALRNMQG